MRRWMLRRRTLQMPELALQSRPAASRVRAAALGKLMKGGFRLLGCLAGCALCQVSLCERRASGAGGR